MSPVFFFRKRFPDFWQAEEIYRILFFKKMHFKAFFERGMTIEVYNNTLLTENSDLQKKNN